LKSKGLLFIGIFLLVLGIVLKNFMGWFTSGLILILSGITCKTVYIIAKARTGAYKPGGELFFLFTGLTLFLAGLVLKSYFTGFLPRAMIIFGIALKIVFIIKFVMIVRSNRELTGKEPE